MPDSLLVGADNEKLVRHVRTLNPTAKIVATAGLLEEKRAEMDAQLGERHEVLP